MKILTHWLIFSNDQSPLDFRRAKTDAARNYCRKNFMTFLDLTLRILRLHFGEEQHSLVKELSYKPNSKHLLGYIRITSLLKLVIIAAKAESETLTCGANIFGASQVSDSRLPDHHICYI